MAQTEQIKELTANLEQGVMELFESGKYEEYLRTMSRFHHYSTRNVLLIHQQDPNATLVASFLAWKNNFNRHVKKGEHGIKIFAPIASKGKDVEMEVIDPVTKQVVLDENGQPVTERMTPTSSLQMRFKVVNVFDAKQTEGDPLPELAETLTGDVERYEVFMDALRAVSPLPIVFEPMNDKDGYCAFGDKIGIREGMSQIQTVSAVIHEIAHAKVHDRALLAENEQPTDNRTAEVQAESISFVVSGFFSIDTGANSIGYVAEWSRNRELKELKASLDLIRKTADELIGGIETKYRELAKERGIDLSVVTDELGAEQNYNMIDGVNNNTPPKDEQEFTQTELSAVPAQAEATQAEPTPPEPETPDYSVILAGYARNAEVRDPRQIGLTILMPLLFEGGNLNRDGKRSRVVVEPPIGKYEMFSRDEGTPPHQTNYLYIMTACGKLADLGERSRIKDLTEARLDDYILRNAAAFEKQLAEPAEWVDYTAAALLNRIEEAEAHNAPVKAMREARSQAEREARIEREKQLAAEKLAIFDARVDEIAKAIESGGSISVAYDAGAYEGKNPVLELFRLYNVALPLRTQGWANNRLAEIKGDSYSFYTRNGGKASSAFMDSYQRLKRAVKLTPIEQKREQLSQQTTPRRGSEKIKMSIEQENYAKFAEMFPDFASRKYSYMKLESPGFEPLSLEWIFGDRVSIMQTYVQEGDLMYDPMIEYTVSDSEKSMNGVSYQNSGMGLYQYHDENGVGRSVDGNGRENIVRDLSGKLNEFSKQWFSNLEEQEHIPVRATLWNEGGIDDVDVAVTFNKDGNVIVDEPQDVTEPAAPDNAPDEPDKPSDDIGAYLPDKPETSKPTPKVGIGFGGTPLPVYDSETGYPASTPPPKVKAEKPVQAEKQTTLDLSLPDPTITATTIAEYGYTDDSMFPMTTERAVELHDAGLCIYLLYPDNTEAMAFDRDEIRLFDGYCGIETADWHNSTVYKAQMAIAVAAPAVSDTRASESNAREADLLYGDNPYYRENKFGIYQIRDDIDEAHNFRFANMKELEALGLTPNRDNYEITLEELDDVEGIDNHAIPADYDIKNFSYTVVGGNVYFRENSLMYPVDLPATTLDRIKGMIGLRDCVKTLIDFQLDEFPDSAVKAQQAKLNTLYDKFNADFGLINSTANNRAFNADSSYYLLSSLEMLNEDGELDRKADMFTKRTIKQKTVVSHVDTASEALAVSLGERACVDLAYMSDLTGKDEQTLFDDLHGVIFLDLPETPGGAARYVTADEFLSGNVREKLAVYNRMAQIVPDDHEHRNAILDNVEALKAVQPKDLEPSEIAVRMGATWINPQYVEQFMYELLNTPLYSRGIYQVKFHNVTGEWQVTGKGKSQFSDVAATVTYGTKRMNGYQIIDDTLNLRDVRVYDIKEDADGKEKRVLNKKETMLAQQKQEIIKQAFKDWIWKDSERRQTLTKLYNETFNSIRPREYDGSHLILTGMNPEYTMRPYQLNATARGIYGGNTLLAHEVGAGKTFTMTAIAMESKRLGLCQKSLFAVPNHLTEQWAAEILRLYPSANILVATKKDFEMRNRKKFCAKIATGDYDAVIIGHSQLEKIPLSRERQTRLLYEQLDEIESGIRELKDNKGERFSIKQLEKTKRNLEARLSKLIEAKQKDDVVTFEQLGCDRLFIDESHNFKNLFMYTKMRNVAGLSTSEAAKSTDLFMKCRYLDELTDGKGVTFATGTPVSNSMTELYTVQRYLQHDTLAAMNLNHFDAWASIFGETQTSIELAPEGTGYRARTRFAKFHNLPELMTMFRDVADIQTADMLKLPVPEVKYENVIVEPSDIQKEMVEELSERAAKVHAKEVDATEDNMLKITTDGRKIGLDQRLMNPLTEDFEGSKVNACTENVFKIWNDTAADRLTQLVFCDFSTPNKDKFNVYDDIKAKLLARGIPENEIAFIHDADTETRKKELFAKVRQGKVRVLFGSTFKMGAGTNVQDKLIAIHDADCPWRPADLAQRAGRIVRFGNNNAEVQIFRYATSGTFDSYLWQTVQKKQEFIAQIMSSKSPMRSCDDVDETALSYAEIKALCAGNPLIAEKMSLDNDVAKLRMLKSEHNSQHYRLEDDILKTYPQQIVGATARISGIEQDLAAYAVEKDKCSEVVIVNGAASASQKFPGMTIHGVTHVEKEPAAKALLDACKGVKGRNIDTPIGEYMGFKLSLQYESFGQNINLYMRGAMTYKVELSTDAFGNITRINNALDKLSERLEGAKESLANAEKQMAAAKEEIAKPFPLEDELAAKSARLALLNADLNIDGDGDFDVINDTESRAETEPEQAQDGDRDEDEFDDDDRYQSDEPRRGDVYPTNGSTGQFVGTRQPAYAETRTGTYGKARPSILDDLDTATKAVKPPVQGGGKSAEIDI
ncbi:hypothetical protein FACS189425_02740 [Clostridia bacterium]|nr:hypothetical protein FACS189425_02740 [Clostridia bacterium]